MDSTTRVQILNVAVYISQNANAHEEGLNRTILPLWVNKTADWAFPLCYGNLSTRRKTEFKPVKLHLKIVLVSHLACAKGLGVDVRLYIYIHGHIYAIHIMMARNGHLS